MHLTDSVRFDAPEFKDLYLSIAKEKGFFGCKLEMLTST